MKHMNIIKKAADAILILLIILSLAACGNAISENASSLSGLEGAAKNTEDISLKGQIKLQGAAPARSATSSFSDNITWVINATSSDFSVDHDQLISGAQASALTSENTFSMKIPKEGTYAFTVLGYPGSYSTIEQVASKTPRFQGYKTGVEITETGLRTALEITVAPLLTGTAPQNADSPVAETSDYGTINLLINDISESISKLSATLTAYQREMDPIIKETTFDGGETTLHIENVPAGKYTAKLDFEDSDGNVIYSCNEAINVYTGMTTDTWFGTAPYLTDGVFAITSALVSKFGAEPVSDSNYVLFGKDDYGFLRYKTFDSISSSSSVSDEDEMFPGAKPIFCFDKDGYFYTVNGAQKIISNKPDFPEGGISLESDLQDVNPYLAVDKTTNILYISVSTGDFRVRKYPNLISSNDASGSEYYSYSATGFNGGEPFAVSNGIVYTVLNKKLNIFDLSKAEEEESVPGYFTISSVKEVLFGWDGYGFSNNAKVTDLLCQDGMLYILLRENEDFNSRGAVIRYNTSTGYIDSLGLADAIDNDSFAGVKVSTYVWDDPDNKPLYNDEACTSKWYVDADKVWYSDYYHTNMTLHPQIYSPNSFESLSTSQFYGPSKFVAIKPKKLVIADDGIAFYTDNDVLKFKNVNRIVTVDLERFAIENTEDTSVIFDSDKSDMIQIGDTGTTEYQEGFVDAVDSSNKKYYENPSNPDDCPLTGVYGKSVIFGIPCGD